MIQIKEFPNQSFACKTEMFKALRENKKALIAQKKMATKFSDSVMYHTSYYVGDKEEVTKSVKNLSEDVNKIKADLVINTTGVMDSHSDVHIKGLWKKSLQEQKGLYLLQEHNMTFDKIISDNVNAKAKDYMWVDLGFNYEGKSQALVFTAEIEKERNPFMFNQYAKGYVKEHSVGMRYIKIDLAIDSNSEYDKEEKDVWDKYFDQIANKEEAQEQGYFWAVTEAKVIEGSAVVKGSNFATPTLNIEAVSDTSKIEPSHDTHKKVNLLDKINSTKIIIN